MDVVVQALLLLLEAAVALRRSASAVNARDPIAPRAYVLAFDN